jgi:hypothetical protein
MRRPKHAEHTLRYMHVLANPRKGAQCGWQACGHHMLHNPGHSCSNCRTAERGQALGQ